MIAKAHSKFAYCLQTIAIACFTVTLLTLTACDEPNLRIAMDEQVPPTFNFSGNGSLAFFVVIEIAPDNLNASGPYLDPRKNRVLWDIRPKGGEEAQAPLPAITYGQVPPGFIQKIPDAGQPSPLSEGKVYQAGGPPVEVPHGYVRFMIQNGKSITLKTR